MKMGSGVGTMKQQEGQEAIAKSSQDILAACKHELLHLNAKNKALTSQVEALGSTVQQRDQIVLALRKRIEELEASHQGSSLRNQSGPEPKDHRGETIVKTRREEISAEANVDVSFKYCQNEFKPVNATVYPKAEHIRNLLEGIVDKNILFRDVGVEPKQQMIDAFKEVNVPANTTVVTEGELFGEHFYVVEAGDLDIFLKPPHQVSSPGEPTSLASLGDHYGRLQSGGCFGELALLYNTARAATIRSRTPCQLWALSRTLYSDIKLASRLRKRKRYEDYLGKVSCLANLSQEEITVLVDALSEIYFEQGTTIIRQGELGDHFYMLASGVVEYQRADEGVVGEGKEGDWFGHKALLTDEYRQATVTARSSVHCLVLNRNDFVSLFGNLQDVLERKGKGLSSTDAENCSVLQTGPEGDLAAGHVHFRNVAFQDLSFTIKGKEQVLGQGAFGKVIMVLDTKGSVYALKCLGKSQIVQNALQSHVVGERNVMAQLDHQFLLKFYNSYWDDRYVYFLLEACLGGELFLLLQLYDRFTEDTTRFYVATVLQAFGYLHSKNILYRDLKPENLMLDAKGYLKVVDFGLAKVVTGKTWTLCGTPDYLAPEIIKMTGHGKAVDYWALGVLIFELCSGYAPYTAPEQLQIYENILRGNIEYPATMSAAVTDIISSLNQLNESKRLGSTKEAIKGVLKHIWFSGFDWNKLLQQELQPPILVSLDHPTDTSNFPEIQCQQEIAQEEHTWVPAFPSSVSS